MSAVEEQCLAPITFIDLLAVVNGMAVDEGALHAPVEGVSLQRTPATLALDEALLQRPGRVGAHQHEVGLPAFADEAALADAIKLGRGVAHLLYNLLYRKDTFTHQLEHAHERELHHWHARNGFQRAAFLLGDEVGGMVGGDDVYHVVIDGTAQGIAVGLGLHGRVALDEGVQRAVVGLAEQQMGHTSLARNLLAADGACLEQVQFAGGGEVEHMQAGTRFARQLHGQARRGVAGGRGADVGVLADGHIVVVGILCLIFLCVFSDDGGVLAMDGNEQVGAAKDGAQAFHAVHQHVACARTHEELDTAHARTIQAGKVAVVVVRSAEVGGVIHDAAFVQQVELGVEGFEGSGLRQGVGHVHDAGHASCSSRPAFAEDVGLVRQARVAEVHVVVDGAWQQVAAGGVDGFVARGGEGFAVGQYFGDAALVGDDYGALYGLSLVDDEGVVDEGTFHVC